ncbi:MAG TPA: methyltransferase domain-containing protein [Actinoplanes sp.]|jgi:SAM-dependent methyltransferase
MTRVFAAGEAVWQRRLGTLRQVVRQELVARQLAEHVGPERRRILDAGCGQGTQALRLAAAGHAVTAVDSSPSLLEALRDQAGSLDIRVVEADILEMPVDEEFDVVLCHGVLMYFADPAPVLDVLAARVSPGGLLSLLVRNADGLALRPGLRGEWPAAREALSGTAYRNRLGLDTRADRRADLTSSLSGRGLTVFDWYGVRVFTDTAADDAPLPPDDELSTLLEAEAEAAHTDPYRSVAALTHLLARRDAYKT